MNIKDYGLKENILKKIDKNKTIARIIATHKDRYEIACNNGKGFAKIKRGCYYDNPNSVYPTTGDFVLIEWNESGDSMIYETLKRESSFSRTAVCRRLRNKKDTPIIMLTAKGDITDKVNGLDIGADDYLTKPFEIEELLARIRVILRRTSQIKNQSKIIQVSDLKLDLEKKQASRNGKNIELTKKEYELLEYLMKNNGIVISREKIIEAVWNYDFIGDTKIVDVFIRYLRSKIDDEYDKKLINTVRGFGYVIQE